MSGPLTPGGGLILHSLMRWPVVTTLVLITIPVLPPVVNPPDEPPIMEVPEEPPRAVPPASAPAEPPKKAEPPASTPLTPPPRKKKLGG